MANNDLYSATQVLGTYQDPAAGQQKKPVASGWEDAGNNLYRNTSNGQMVDYYHPIYQQALNAAPAAPAGGAPTAPAGPAAPTVDSVFRDKLMGLMQKDPTQVTAQDPALKGQMDAFSAGRQLAQRQEREATAERMNAQGLGQSGAKDVADIQSYENMGRDIGSYGAGLVGQEVSAQRDMLKSALAMAGDRLTNEERNALEMKLAQLDAQVKREGIQSQDALGRGDLDLRRYLGDSQYSLGLLNSMMQNSQFNNDLGFRIGNAEAGFNRDALLSLMR
jgi:hypothetical protein